MGSLAAVAFRAKETLFRRQTFALLPKVLAHQNLSPEQIQEKGWRRLQAMVRFAAEHVPYYQQAWQGLELDDALAGPTAFAQIPIIERADLNAAGLAIAAPDLPGRLDWTHTSGSSGDRLHFWSDRQRSAWSTAARIRAWRWWGLDYGARTVRIHARPYYGGSALKQRLAHGLLVASNQLCGTTRISAFDMSEADMQRHVEAIMRIDPALVYGYGGSLERLAEYMQHQGLRLNSRRLAAVSYISEPASEAGRRLMQQVFGAPVTSEYLSREFGLIAHECPHGNLHLSDDNLYLEVIDKEGQPVVDQVGQVILSDLRPSRTPYIRYRLGDMAALASHGFQCPCGSPLRVLRQLSGRTFEQIHLRDGGALPPYVFDWLLDTIEGVSHWQARITPPNQLRLLVETTPEKLTPARERMLAWVNDRLNHEYDVTIEAVPRIAPSPSGKYAKIVHEEPST